MSFQKWKWKYIQKIYAQQNELLKQKYTFFYENQCILVQKVEVDAFWLTRIFTHVCSKFIAELSKNKFILCFC